MRRILQIKLCKGFTLAELLIVIVVIGIIAVVGVPSMISYLDYSAGMTCESYAETVLAEIERYLVTAQFCERKDADDMIARTLERNSSVEVTISENDESSRSTVIRSLSGEYYLVCWIFNSDDDIPEIIISCSEHEFEAKKSFKLSYIGEIGYIKPPADPSE